MTRREQRTVVLPLAPPRRLLAPLRYRAFKTGPDRIVWDQVLEPVRSLMHDDWWVVGVVIDWGSSLPFAPGSRERVVREFLDWGWDYSLVMHAIGHGRGSTTVGLER